MTMLLAPRVRPRGARRARWAVGLALLLVWWTSPALAAITASFYSHPWGTGKGGFIYFPHAFVVIERTSSDGAPPVREAYGYTAVAPSAVLLARKGKGKVTEPDPRYTGVSRLHFAMTLDEAQYAALKAAIAGFGDAYDLDKRNCITFVATLAQAVGLQVDQTGGRNPSKFLDDLRKANAARLAAPPSGAATAVTAVEQP